MAVANNEEPLFVHPVLLRRAEELRKQRLQSDPDDCGVLRSLADVYRKQGKLSEAAVVLNRLCQLDPRDQEAGYLEAILGGKNLPAPPLGIRPAPFVMLPGFLPQTFHDGLIPLLSSLRDKLAPALLGDGEYLPDRRDTLDYLDKWEGQERFRGYVKKALPGVIPRLCLSHFRVKHVEVYLCAYMDGHFFKVHMDAPRTSPRASRVISFVYYFHKKPRPYTGGELLLFDSDVAEHVTYTSAHFTCIVPEDNSLVLFPSRFYHCVLPVRCPSKDFADSRFVVNGFIHAAAETLPPA